MSTAASIRAEPQLLAQELLSKRLNCKLRMTLSMVICCKRKFRMLGTIKLVQTIIKIIVIVITVIIIIIIIIIIIVLMIIMNLHCAYYM